MTKDAVQQKHETYLSTYGDIESEERERVLRQLVTDDIVSVLPNGENRGLQAVLLHIEEFRQQRPGAYFKCNKFSYHHNQFLAEITLYNADNVSLASAHTYGRLNEQGLIAYLIGFF